MTEDKKNDRDNRGGEYMLGWDRRHIIITTTFGEGVF